MTVEFKFNVRYLMNGPHWMFEKEEGGRTTVVISASKRELIMDEARKYGWDGKEEEVPEAKKKGPFAS